MKTILLLTLLLLSGVSFTQDFNDTLFYKSGAERPVHVVKETKNALSYKYKKDNGWIVSGRTRKSILRGYVIYDSNDKLVTSEKKPLKKLPANTQTEQVDAAGSFAVGFLAGVATGVGGVLLFIVALF